LREYNDRLVRKLEEKVSELQSANEALNRDISERERTQKELLESDGRFRAIFEHALDGILVADVKTKRFVAANPEMCRMLGYTEEEVVHLSVMDIHPAADLPDVLDEFERVASRGTTLAADIPVKRRNGEVFFADINASMLAWGDKTHLIGIFRDVTERKCLEERSQQSRKMEAIGQLVGGVAHDFNNILQVILGHCCLAALNLPPKSGSCADLEEIQKAADLAAGLTRQLLAFSHRQVLRRKDIDLDTVITNLTQMLQTLIGEDIELEVNAGKDLHPVYADPVQITQILINLCVNARDAMPEGGKITLGTENIVLDADYQRLHPWARQGDYVLLSVSDTGIGMDGETLSHIFEPFFTTKALGKGTGLGLPSVYAIVKQHEGCVDVDSVVGEGTTFRIHFPVAEQTADTVEETVESALVGGSETILVAEDDETIRNMTKRLLEGAGYTVHLAADGVEAAEVFADNAHSISLVLLDVVMPRLGGRRVYELMKGLKPAVQVLFTSGYSAHAVQARFISGEHMHFLQKPYKWHALLKRIRQILDASP